jgi:hypothetical protein
MATYSDFIDRLLLNPGLLGKLMPAEPLDWELPGKIRDATDAVLSGGKEMEDPRMFTLVRGGLFYAADALDDAHRIFQEGPGDLASYWHGMVHRREGDFDNARYWFSRAGQLPIFDRMHGAAANLSSNMAKQSSWDAYLLTGMCEQAKFGDRDAIPECVRLQRVEFDAMLDYCWRQSRLR